VEKSEEIFRLWNNETLGTWRYFVKYELDVLRTFDITTNGMNIIPGLIHSYRKATSIKTK
jgi:hypothetical protein